MEEAMMEATKYILVFLSGQTAGLIIGLIMVKLSGRGKKNGK